MCTTHHSPKKGTPKAQNAHDKEHATWNRRSFIQALGLAGMGSIMVGKAAVSASQATPLSIALANSENDKILVIVRLKGGNDGLNTIVPVYDYDTYANLRPTIRHQENQLTALNADFAIPSYMNSLESMWAEGQMKIIHGVGYPNQNLSHFTSSDIWASALPDQFEPTGWWGRYFEDVYPDYLINPPASPPAIQIGSVGNLIFEGADTNYAFSVANPAQLASVAENGSLHDVLNLPDCLYGDKLLFMRSTANTTFTYSQVLNDAYLGSSNQVDYQEGQLANNLSIVARMIKGGLGTKVYMVTLDGFDTHANQLDNHRTLLEDLSNSIKAFFEDLSATGMQNEVLAMTISEFGRRPYENGSNGTDHGAASPVMLFGNGLEGSGFVGTHPDLSTWDNNDNLIPTEDFRDVYATVLTDWFCLDPTVVSNILLNQDYETLNLGFNCETLGTTDYANVNRFEHFAVYENNRTYLTFTMLSTAHVDIKLYDILGQEVGTLANEIYFPGKQRIDIKAKIGGHLTTAQYIYRIALGGQFYSKSILLK